ncbi:MULTISPECIES: efflux RND transporter permease subunit [unclassified Nitratiruptor]|uniref:efflux RND transporter permease subunit n=1 Tax=unclassified Nitratiruptor TaxID=2624044 RepID=UPI0019157B8E|nr:MULTISPECIES: CusA/CzcA family heavy metal efflux RND transporter [unclassified Nitratiruptor]BCD60382.1 Cu(I)/Ag(I) efflux system membrane protein CusA/SilA [Nitratiruptor sp. YY08-10]BCD64129.1 Cu(I)/Ag(I) efflux system membrane protein CusA/SilA [Nitratiruptor sp. YY08-14]
MIEKIIELSAKNRFLILLFALIFAGASYWAIKKTPLDAIPDLTPPQVIIQVKFPGQSPKIIEDQVTYPLTSSFLAISDIDTVRGFSTYENALIYIIFKDGTNLYDARTRVLEELSKVAPTLPKNAEVSLGPDASGVGWVYEYALVSNTKDLAQLRTYQDYTLKYALLGIDGVSEVAGVGGFIPNYQVTIDNHKLIEYGISVKDIVKTLELNNNDVGGGITIQNGYEWMIQARGYIKSLQEIEELSIKTKRKIPLKIKDIARVEWTAMPRRGLADLNGQGEVVGGIVIAKYGANVYATIKKVKEKLSQLQTKDIKIIPTYDRSKLIEDAVSTLKDTLIEESIIVLVVIGFFLFHFRSTLIVLIVLPLTIGLTFLLMKIFGIGSNIMSLGGIAIAIGAMVDASIVMIENAHKKLDSIKDKNSLTPSKRVSLIIESCQQVGRPIFFALALVVVSFLPIFAMQGQEGKLFTPLAFTKTFAMSVGAILAITIVPALMIWFIKDVPDEKRNPINRFFIWLYHPFIVIGLKLRYILIPLSVALLLFSYPLYKKLKWEFMPPLNEGVLMYMPVTPYGISIDQAKMLTQMTDKVIASFDEVETVFGKAGRADTATDPAPISMIETIITLKNEKIDMKKLLQELDEAVQVPGLVNSWTYPIRGRIDMLLSGIRTPLGIKLYGDDIKKLQILAKKIETKLAALEQTESVFADRSDTGYYIDIDTDPKKLALYGLKRSDVLDFVSFAIGGKKITTKLKNIERYPISIQLEEEQRNSLESIKELRIKTKYGYIPLKEIANVHYEQSASVLKSEKAKPVTYIYITPMQGVSASEYKKVAQNALQSLTLPKGYFYEWAGSSEYLQSAMNTFKWIVPSVLLIILILIYFALGEIVPTLFVFLSLPFAFLGGLLYIDYLGFNMSVAVVVGFLALLGIAAETAIVMIIYLKESVEKYEKLDKKLLVEAIYEGAVQRVRPKLMTVFAILAGLLPIMYTNKTGSEVMQRIAAPMIGGVATSAVLSLIIIPLLYMIYIQISKKIR